MQSLSTSKVKTWEEVNEIPLSSEERNFVPLEYEEPNYKKVNGAAENWRGKMIKYLICKPACNEKNSYHSCQRERDLKEK